VLDVTLSALNGPAIRDTIGDVVAARGPRHGVIDALMAASGQR